jgi:hypothetical protein
MTPLQTAGFLLGTAFASGLNLYATVAALGLLHRAHVITLPPQLDLLAHPWVLGVAAVLYAAEFIADKVPWFDSFWDVVHTFIRPPAAALLAWAAVGPVPEAWKLSAALLAGTVAFTSHGAKASTRAAANTSPEPFTNWALSLTEDAVAVLLVWMAGTHPYLTSVIVVLLLVASVYLIVKLFGLARRAARRLFSRRPFPSASGSSF